MSFINGTSTQAFLSCNPTAPSSTVWNTVYVTTLPAACPTGQWMATYTVTEQCTGDKAAWTPPAIPNGFVVTTVSCDVCKPTEIEITCPGAQPTEPGMATVTIKGNGVTATITAAPTSGPAEGGNPGGAPAPGGGSPGASGGVPPGNAAAPGGSSPSDSGDMGMGPGSNGTAPSPPITAGAPSVRSLALGGLFAVALAQFSLL